MNIVTTKEAFSDENQAKNPQKTEAPRRRGRPRKNPLTAEPVGADSTLTAMSRPDAPIALPQPGDGTEVTSLHPDGKLPPPANGRGQTFYQAAKPRTEGFGRPPQPQAQRVDIPIDPRTLAAQAREARFRNESTPPPAPAVATPPSRDRNNGFTTAPRRRDRHQLPADGAGVFLQPNSKGQGFAPLATPRNDSKERLKIIPLGGLEEIGKNMTVFEYGNDILIVDMGFMFPDHEMFGVDYIIPDISYLEDKKDKIRGAILTHGHLDHIGAVPYLVEKLGFPTMYGTPITIGLVKQRLEEFGLLAQNKVVNIDPEKDVLQLGCFTVRPFRLIHSIPGALGLEIETPNGRIAYCTDWKFDYNPASGEAVDYQALAAVGGRGVDLLFSDSTNAEKPGHSISEKVVEQSLAASVEAATGRIIVAMFASSLARIQQTINIAARNNRKVLVVGRSMVKNVEMAVSLKAMTIPPHTLISEREANRFNDNKILILSTGAQGEDRSALQRMASGEHRVIKIKKGDTVIISASPIPGNERSVNGLMDILYKAGANVVYNKIADVHTSGHAYAEDLKLMLALMKPKYFIPLHGERSKLMLHGKLAEEVGVAPERILIGDNGLILEMDNTGKVEPTDNHVPAGYVMVDGLGVGDVGNIVLRDRQAMAQEGVFVVISVFDQKKRQFLTSPDIISRGFIYMRENEHFINEVRQEIKRYLTKSAEGRDIDLAAIKNDLRDLISKMLYEKTERNPMVIPVIIEV